MAFSPRISTLNGANQFWKRYGVHIEHDDELDIYRATFLHVNAEPRQAKTLTKLWFALGDFLIKIS